MDPSIESWAMIAVPLMVLWYFFSEWRAQRRHDRYFAIAQGVLHGAAKVAEGIFWNARLSDNVGILCRQIRRDPRAGDAVAAPAPAPAPVPERPERPVAANND